MIKPDSTQPEKHLVRKTMKALGIIILFGLFIMMIAFVVYIYRTSCMTMLLSAIGLTALLLAEIATFILIMKIMHKKGMHRHYTFLAAVIFLFFCSVTMKYILFPPVREIPVTGSYQIGTEDYWVTWISKIHTSATEACGSCKSEKGFLLMRPEILRLSLLLPVPAER